uniref:Uncharacterized protein n=1 Tax=Chromera velia CCMP2878 TaxID=1169474 RepID=A0A0G4HLR2_9ALVE|eukprot:Cvel_28864.t1-p1 / transcript=Cvel_28864.t1 / gene=Cvel_28864 / organism=Chromera_velia_CCMP2878 / gene_product=hypothetical protein / transcript_product=hypothetical protein / location=Cvel_scaffold3855:3631-5083(+) / protein_length=264 / sequence_SO=supercontig / SO=protein_coding / is_pseudo=false
MPRLVLFAFCTLTFASGNLSWFFSPVVSSSFLQKPCQCRPGNGGPFTLHFNSCSFFWGVAHPDDRIKLTGPCSVEISMSPEGGVQWLVKMKDRPEVPAGFFYFPVVPHSSQNRLSLTPSDYWNKVGKTGVAEPAALEAPMTITVTHQLKDLEDKQGRQDWLEEKRDPKEAEITAERNRLLSLGKTVEAGAVFRTEGGTLKLMEPTSESDMSLPTVEAMWRKCNGYADPKNGKALTGMTLLERPTKMAQKGGLKVTLWTVAEGSH